MRKFGEDEVQRKALKVLEQNGWEVPRAKGKTGARVLDEEYDRKKSEVIYWNILREKIVDLNDNVDRSEAREIVGKLKRKLGAENLIDANEEFQEILRKGVQHTLVEDGEEKDTYVQLVDASDEVELTPEELSDNVFHAVDEFQVNRKSRSRPDVSLFINGIPLVHIELKSGTRESQIGKAIRDLIDYEEDEPRMFAPCVLNVAASAFKFRTAAIGSSKKHYFPWRSENDEKLELEQGIESLLRPEVLVDILRNYSFFREGAKITPRYNQYRAANKIVKRVKKDDHRKGLIWHTQGSGKSYTMLLASQKLRRTNVENRQIILVVDRSKLEDQMETDLEEIGLSHSVANSIQDLNKKLKEDKNQILLTTMQKFQDTGSELKQDGEDPVVMVDECHRFFEAELGSKMKAALPDAFYFGFTGTPVVEDGPEGRNTFEKFSPDGEDYLDRYSILEGQRDGIIVEVAFRQKRFKWDVPDAKIDREFEKRFEDMDLDERREAIREYVNQATLAEIRPRLEAVTEHIRKDYRDKLKDTKFKGMVVTPSRRAAALYCDEIRKYWDEDEVEALITINKDDDKQIKKYRKSYEEEREVIESFKNQENPKLLIVCDKLLTGFDAPNLRIMYLDKSLKNHNLLQAIARTNRPTFGKENGEIVDYQGVFSDMDDALEYSDELEIKDNAVKNEEELAERWKDLLAELMDIFEDIEFDGSPEAFNKCIVRLQKNTDDRAKFQAKYKEAENLYEALQPHEVLGKEEHRRRYEILAQIFYRFREVDQGRDPEQLSIESEEVRKETRKILEENIEVEEKEEEDIEYEIDSPEVSHSVEDEEPDYTVAVDGPGVIQDIAPMAQKNPVYEKLSERVKEVLSSWRKDEISSAQASERIEQVKSEIEKIESERESMDLSDSGFAVYEILKTEQDFEADQAEEISRAIDSRLDDIQLSYNFSEARKDVQKAVIESLNDAGHLELAKTDFLEKSVDYILENRHEFED